MTKAQEFAARIQAAGTRPVFKLPDGQEYACVDDEGHLLMERGVVPHALIPAFIAFLAEHFTEPKARGTSA